MFTAARWSAATAALLAVLASAPFARAADAPKKIKLALTDLKVTGEIPAARVQGLSSLIASELAASPQLQVVTGADIAAMLGLERQKAILGCGDASCLAEIGGALGVDYIVGAEVGKVGSSYLLTLSLVDVAKSAPLARLTRKAGNEDELVDVTPPAARELMSKVPGLESTASAGTASAGGSQGGGSSALGWIALGTGVVAAGVGGYFYATAWLTAGDFETGQADSAKPTVTHDEADSAELGAAIGVGLLAGGAAIAGLSYFLFPGDAGSGGDVAVVPLEGGAMAAVRLPLTP